MTDRHRNAQRPCVRVWLQHHVLRRALARASVELDRGARRGAGWLHLMGLSAAEADALARELRTLTPATSVTRFRPAEIIR
jgi:hypothetical protein